MRFRPEYDEWRPEGQVESSHNISTALDGEAEYINTQIAKRLIEDKYKHTYTQMVRDKTLPKNIGTLATASNKDRHNGKYLLDYNDGFMIVSDRVGDGRVWLSACATTLDLAKEMVDNFTEQLGEFEGAIVPEGQVRVNFWNQSVRGPVRRPRKLDMPTWDEIRCNYESHTAKTIDEFMTMKDWDDSRGKLIIWRGDPGLGKTYALRAMCDNWQSWSSIHYITDPEQFLSDPDYLYGVMGFDEDEQPGLLAMFDVEDEDEPKPNNPITHRLIILEDAGELVGAEARAETGQALSRLLNAVDGMFGQGTRCVLMITTNEEKGKLHDAVGRHGRCAKDVTFKSFSLDEAKDWLSANGGNPDDARKNMSLADLYAAMHNHKNTDGSEIKTLGFAGV